MLRVLVVEANPVLLQRVARQLGEVLSGYEVSTASSRDEALALLPTARPDLVILNLLLPAASGDQQRDPSHGESVLDRVRELHPDAKAVLFSCSDAAAASGPRSVEGLRAKVQQRLASLAYDLGDRPAAQAQAERSLELHQAFGDERVTADALNLLGLLAFDDGDIDGARQHFERALSLRTADDHHGRAVALHNLARLAARRGDPAAAHVLYRQALAHRDASGDARGKAETLGNLGALAHTGGDHAEAQRLYRESLALYDTARDRYGIAVMLNNLGELAEAAGHLEAAVGLLVQSERIFRDLTSPLASAPAAHLSRIAEQLEPEQLTQMQLAAQAQRWEGLVAQCPLSPGKQPAPRRRAARKPGARPE